ncbi:MAG: PBP1A family penicillin-binding protein [Patescibacteria group bacterium]|nr:PBP1A family penicillin-binding protein [Patescibacteria group bacterium]
MNKKTKLPLGTIGIISLLVIIAAGLFFYILIMKDLPSPSQIENRKVIESTKIYDRTGQTLLYEIHGQEKRTVIPFTEIPDYVKKALIALEDQTFYTHPAFDIKGIIRAFISDIANGGASQGGSTLTQQLAKNAFLTQEKTITRKIKELILAVELEQKYSKDEILDLYLNQSPFGGNNYGIQAASQSFFDKDAKDLDLAQSALIVSVLQAPTYYSPWGTHVKELYARKDYALDQMYKLGYITEKQMNNAKTETFKFAPQATGMKAPHFVQAVQDYLDNKYGENYVETAGLKVITTLDWNMQQLAEKAIKDGADRNTSLYQGYNAALVAQDATTGQILAMVGSKDYFSAPEPAGCIPGKNCKFEGNFNVATQGLRQPGSTMKPFAYITAFEKGYTPNTMLFDVPTEFTANDPNCPIDNINYNGNNPECFHPQDFDPDFKGPIDMRNSLAQSINITSVKTLYLAGLSDTLKTASDFGITTLTEKNRYGLSLVLGGGEVKLIDLVGAYSVFAQEGIKHQQSMILKITNSQGQTIEEYKDLATRVVDAKYPIYINDILSDTEARSGLLQNSLPLTIFDGYEVALKTGTTNDYHDAWTVGYTPDFVVGVWAGNNDNTPMQRQGSSLLAAVPMWSAFMKNAIKTTPQVTFSKPNPILAQKSILNGQFTVNFKVNGSSYPQIHNILFYVNKNDPQGLYPENPQNDPQFQNWEIPVLKWANDNIPDFNSTYNKPIPIDEINRSISASTNSAVISANVDWLNPKNGDFIKSENTQVTANITANFEIGKVELYFNGSLITTTPQQSFGKNYIFNYNLNTQMAESQNLLKLKIYDIGGNSLERSIILFK